MAKAKFHQLATRLPMMSVTAYADGGTAGAGYDEGASPFVQDDDDPSQWITPVEQARRRAMKLQGAGAPIGPEQTSGAVSRSPTPATPPPAPLPPGPDLSYLHNYNGVIDTKKLPQFAIDALNGKQPNALDKLSTGVADKVGDAWNAAGNFDPGHVKEKVLQPVNKFLADAASTARGLNNGAAGYGLGSLQSAQLGDKGGQRAADFYAPTNIRDAALTYGPGALGKAKDVLPLLRGLGPESSLTGTALRAGIDTSAFDENLLKQLGTSKKELDAIIAKPGSQRTKADFELLQRAMGWEEAAAPKAATGGNSVWDRLSAEPDMPAKLPSMAAPESNLAPDITARLKANVEAGLKPPVAAEAFPGANLPMRYPNDPPLSAALAVESTAPRTPGVLQSVSISPEDAAAAQAQRDALAARPVNHNAQDVVNAEALSASEPNLPRVGSTATAEERTTPGSIPEGWGNGGLPPNGTMPPAQPPALPPEHASDFNLRHEVLSALGIPQALKATADASAPGRQGIALAFRHPIEWVQSWKPMIQAWMSDEGMAAVNNNISSMMEKYGAITPHFNTVGGAGEATSRIPGFEAQGDGYIAGAIRKIPGIQKSERAYATFLNYQRAKTFDTMASSLQRAGGADPKSLRNLANIIDHATGWGAAPLKGDIESRILFAQRFVTSRFQFLADPIVEGLMKGDLNAARAATENLVAFGGGMAGLLETGKQAGIWDVTMDPRSTDFGKIRIGSQRIDIGGGFLPLLRTAARMATSESRSVTGEVYHIDPKNEALKFFTNKLAPIPADAYARWTGKTPTGDKPPKLLSAAEARNLFMPLIADSMLEAYQTTGRWQDVARAGGAELVGGNASTFGKGQTDQLDIARQTHGADYDSLYAPQQAAINKQIADSGTPLSFQDRSNAWYNAQQDALSRWKADQGTTATDPMEQEALKVTDYKQLAPTLTKWGMDTYGWDKSTAEKAVAKFTSESGLDDQATYYRKDILEADPGFLDAWQKAYDNGETKFAPPKWAKDFVKDGK